MTGLRGRKRLSVWPEGWTGSLLSLFWAEEPARKGLAAVGFSFSSGQRCMMRMPREVEGL